MKMSISSTATYSHGMLLLPQPLELPEGARVFLQIQTESRAVSATDIDPLAGVIGIGESGREAGADQHDDYLKPWVT